MQKRTDPRTMEQIYSYAPRAQVQLLEAFRERVDPIWALGGAMRAWSVGVGRRAMVFLPAGIGHGEIFFPYLLGLQHHIRCVAFSLPAVSQVDTLCGMLRDALEEIGVARVLLVGNSLGGMIAQRFTRLYPEMTDAMVLLTTAAPTQDVPPEILRSRQKAQASAQIRFLPFSATRRALPAVAFRRFCPEEYREKMAFWEAYYEDVYQNQAYKKQHLALNVNVLRSIYAQRWTVSDLENWPGRVILFESPEDAVYRESEREALKKLYPQAEVHSMSGGQFLAMVHESEVRDRLQKLAGERTGGPGAKDGRGAGNAKGEMAGSKRGETAGSAAAAESVGTSDLAGSAASAAAAESVGTSGLADSAAAAKSADSVKSTDSAKSADSTTAKPGAIPDAKGKPKEKASTEKTSTEKTSAEKTSPEKTPAVKTSPEKKPPAPEEAP